MNLVGSVLPSAHHPDRLAAHPLSLGGHCATTKCGPAAWPSRGRISNSDRKRRPGIHNVCPLLALLGARMRREAGPSVFTATEDSGDPPSLSASVLRFYLPRERQTERGRRGAGRSRAKQVTTKTPRLLLSKSLAAPRAGPGGHPLLGLEPGQGAGWQEGKRRESNGSGEPTPRGDGGVAPVPLSAWRPQSVP